MQLDKNMTGGAEDDLIEDWTSNIDIDNLDLGPSNT